MSKMTRLRRTTKKTTKTFLQLAICGAISAAIVNFDLAPLAFVCIASLMGLTVVAMLVTRAIYDEEMKVRKFWRGKK